MRPEGEVCNSYMDCSAVVNGLSKFVASKSIREFDRCLGAGEIGTSSKTDGKITACEKCIPARGCSQISLI
jgi:hypothetical protein